jgi:hypothetical protein
VNSAPVGQRVYNVYHHLEDQSLPYDLWTHDAEVAAIIYLLKSYPRTIASARYAHVVRAYNDSNNRIGIDVRPFNATLAEVQIKIFSLYMDMFSQDTSASKIYESLLAGGFRTTELALHSYSIRAMMTGHPVGARQ